MCYQTHIRSAFTAAVFMAILALVLTQSRDASCQVVTWLGNSTSWENSSNWDLGYVPGYQNDVHLPSGLTFYPNLTYSWVFMNNMQADEGTTLSMYSEGNCQVNVYGNWSFAGNFNPGGGQINFRGATPCLISPCSFTTVNFARYIVTPFGPSTSIATLSGDITVSEYCLVDTCQLETGTNTIVGSGSAFMAVRMGTLRIGTRDFPTGFAIVDALNGTVEYNGLDDQAVSADFEYGNLNVFGAGYKILDGDVLVHGNLMTGSDALFYFMGHDLAAHGAVTVNGPLYVDQGSRLLLDHSTLTFGSNGMFSAVGDNWAGGPVVSRPQSSSDFYSFTVGSATAVIGARFATFEYMDSLGINIAADGATVLPENCFDHCRFQNGQNVEGAVLLTLNNSQHLEIRNAVFPTMGWINVRKTVSAGTVTMINASGVFAGAAYEQDPYNRIDWLVYPDLFLPDTSHDFGQVLVGESETWLMQVVNDGQQVLNITEITPSPFPTFFCDPTGQQSLQPLDTLTVEVVFEPQSEGQFQGSIMLLSNDPYQDTAWVSLTGECIINSVPSPTQPIPTEFALRQNYPNPFNPKTTLVFELPVASQVRLDVYDINGRLVTTLVNGWQGAGTHEMVFDASHLSSGVYFYCLQAGEFNAVRKMVLMK